MEVSLQLVSRVTAMIVIPKITLPIEATFQASINQLLLKIVHLSITGSAVEENGLENLHVYKSKWKEM